MRKVLLILIFTLVTASVFTQDNEYTRETIRGIKGLKVVIAVNIDKGSLITESQLLTDIELKLRLAGIKVLKEEEWEKTPGMPYLGLGGTIYYNDITKIYNYSLTLRLHQAVYLVRDTDVIADGSTWAIGNMGGTPDIYDIRNDVKDIVDKFINAYLSVNPK